METFKPASKVFIKIIAVTIFCFFVAISLLVMCNGFGTEKIGYTAYGATEEDDELKELYTYYYTDYNKQIRVMTGPAGSLLLGDYSICTDKKVTPYIASIPQPECD